MKALVGLMSAATLAGFSWFGWHGMHDGISSQLNKTATEELVKNHIDDVTIEFDYLDGLVYGAVTPEQKQEVREILNGKLPMSRLVFIDESGRGTDLAFPDTTEVSDAKPDTIDVYSQALIDSESAVERTGVKGTDLAFEDAPSETNQLDQFVLRHTQRLGADANESVADSSIEFASVEEPKQSTTFAATENDARDEYQLSETVAAHTQFDAHTEDKVGTTELPDTVAELEETTPKVQDLAAETVQGDRKAGEFVDASDTSAESELNGSGIEARDTKEPIERIPTELANGVEYPALDVAATDDVAADVTVAEAVIANADIAVEVPVVETTADEVTPDVVSNDTASDLAARPQQANQASDGVQVVDRLPEVREDSVDKDAELSLGDPSFDEPIDVTSDDVVSQPSVSVDRDPEPQPSPPSTSNVTELTDESRQAAPATDSSVEPSEKPSANVASPDIAPTLTKSKQKARLGVYMTNNPNDNIVRVIDAGSAADLCGIQVGDRIAKIGKTRVAEFKDVVTAVGKHSAGDVVQIWFRRNGTLFVVDSRLQGQKHPAVPNNLNSRITPDE